MAEIEAYEEIVFKLEKAKKRILMLESEISSIEKENNFKISHLEEELTLAKQKLATRQQSKHHSPKYDSTLGLVDDSLYFCDMTIEDVTFKPDETLIDKEKTSFELHTEPLLKEIKEQKISFDNEILMLKEENKILNQIIAEVDTNLKVIEEEKTKITFQFNERNKENEDEIQDLKSKLLKTNNKLVDFLRIQAENEALKGQLNTLEINYVDTKDKVVQGNNLFVEVDERKKEAEQIAMNFKKEILKLRSERNNLQRSNTQFKEKIGKMSKLITNTNSNYKIESDPRYIVLDDINKHYYFQVDKSKQESSDHLYEIRKLREEMPFLHDHENYCLKYDKLNKKYNELNKMVQTYIKRTGEAEFLKNEAEYKLKVCEYHVSMDENKENMVKSKINKGTSVNEKMMNEFEGKVDDGETECKTQ